MPAILNIADLVSASAVHSERWDERISDIRGQDDGLGWTGQVLQYRTGFASINSSNAGWRNLQFNQGFTIQRTTEGLKILRTTVGVGGFDGFIALATPIGVNENLYQAFHAALEPRLAGFPVDAPSVPSLRAFVLEVVVRKQNAGDTPFCWHCVGLGQGDIAPSGGPGQPRLISGAVAGLIGDGSGGFRVGSVGCPDAATGITPRVGDEFDVGTVSPAILAAPEDSWFKFTMKLFPATATQLGRWLGFINDVLVGTFVAPAQVPRGEDGNNNNYRFLMVIAGGSLNPAGGGGPDLEFQYLRTYETENLTDTPI